MNQPSGAKISDHYDLPPELVYLFGLHFPAWPQQHDFSQFNWDKLYQLIVEHRVINRVMVSEELAKFPAELQQKLKTYQLQQKQKSLQQLAILIELKKIISYPFIVLKGLPLAQQLYGDYSYRDCRDIDILVEKKHIREVVDLFIQKGFIQKDKLILRFYHHHVTFTYQGQIIELHWQLSPLQKIGNVKDMMQNANKIKLGHETFLTLDQATQAHYLLVHGAGHQWARLIWLVDFSKINFSIEIGQQLPTHYDIVKNYTYNIKKTNSIFDAICSKKTSRTKRAIYHVKNSKGIINKTIIIHKSLMRLINPR